ncbi:MAG: hypothetical protein KF878_02365 [Planctomycetes bacterium]|nr:hypothetical protein [Planctomycetota bacterium]
MARITVTLDPDSPLAVDVELDRPAATIGSSRDADVVVPDLAPAQASVVVDDAHIWLLAAAEGVSVGGAPLARGARRVVRPCDLVRFEPSGRALRVRASLLALGLRPALLRAGVIGVPSLLLAVACLALGGWAEAASVIVFGALAGLPLALGALLELLVGRRGPTPRRRLGAALLTVAVALACLVAAHANAEYTLVTLREGGSVANDRAIHALARRMDFDAGHRFVALALTLGLVADLRWWRRSSGMTTLAVSAVGSTVVTAATCWGLQVLGRGVRPRGVLELEVALTWAAAVLLALASHALQRYGPGAEPPEP